VTANQPPLHPPPGTIIAAFTQDGAHNRRELDACVAKAAELGMNVWLPPGDWPLDPPSSV
jgi:hypothetical protein